MFALIDCNSFFASCEAVFNPALHGKPVVVLSNNDGCVVARSAMAKKLGIPMGEPYFKIKERCVSHDIVVFSSNYQLYGDMSNRVMATLATMVDEMEIYSIDEAFLTIEPALTASLEEQARAIRARVLQWTGIPVSVGVAPTKTLAKIANRYAKHQASAHGVCVLTDQALQDHILAAAPVEDIWGIGHAFGKRLRGMGIYTAAMLRDADIGLIRKLCHVLGERIVHELRATSCLELEEVRPARKQIIASRSFGRPVYSLAKLHEAISDYTARAAMECREDGSKAQVISAYIRTSPFLPEHERYQAGRSIGFVFPTSDTSKLIAAAKQIVTECFLEGKPYQKAGVVLSELVSGEIRQGDLFMQEDPHDTMLAARRMETIDYLNDRMGKYTVFFAAQGNKARRKEWIMRRDFCSPRYTTSWEELLRLSI